MPATADPRVTEAAETTAVQVEAQFTDEWLRDQVPGVFGDENEPEAEGKAAEAATPGEGEGEAAPQVAAETPEPEAETPDKPAEEPEVPAKPAETKPPTTPAATETKPTEPATTTTTETPKDLRVELKRVSGKLTDLRKQLAAVSEIDLVDNGKLLKDINDATLEQAQLQNEMLAQVDEKVIRPAETQAQQETFWEKWAEANPGIDPAKAFEVWDECLAEAGKRFKSEEAVVGYATAIFDAKLPDLKAKPTPTPAPKPAPARTTLAPKPTAGGARVVPAGAAPSRPTARTLSTEERLKNGEASDFVNEIENI